MQLWFESWLGVLLCSWSYFTFTVPLCTQKYICTKKQKALMGVTFLQYSQLAL